MVIRRVAMLSYSKCIYIEVSAWVVAINQVNKHKYQIQILVTFKAHHQIELSSTPSCRFQE